MSQSIEMIGQMGSNIMIPGKIIINMGMARCGTTATSKLFESELEGFKTPTGVKELKFFLKDGSLAEYLNRFTYAEGDILFESSPPYMHSGYEVFEAVIRRIKEFQAAGVEVHLLFHVRNLVKRAFSHYWHDINGHHAIYGRLWSVRSADDPRRLKAKYDTSFPDELRSAAGQAKMCPAAGEMIQYALGQIGKEFVHIAHLPSIDEGLQDLLARIAPEKQIEKLKVPRLPGVKAPEYLPGGKNGTIYSLGTGDQRQDVEIPEGCCVLLARRHSEMLEEEKYDLSELMSSMGKWTNEVTAGEIENIFQPYTAQQRAIFDEIPRDVFLADSKDAVMKEAFSIPPSMRVERREVLPKEVLPLVWERQAIAAEQDGKVTAGRNGRLFLHNDMNEVLAQHLGEVEFTEDDARKWADTIGQREDFCAELGARYGMIFAPDTHAVYREDLPDLDNTEASRPILRLLNAYEGSKVFYPCKELRDARKNGEVCDETDSHWSPYGAYVVYKKSFPTIFPGGYAIKDSEIRLSEQVVIGDLGAKFTPPRKGRTTQVVLKKSTATKIWNNKINNRGHMSFWTNANRSLPKAILLTDSYGWRFQRFLAESCSSLFVVHSPLLERDLIKMYRPDIVISLMAERFLPKIPDDDRDASAVQMAQKKNPDFVLPDLEALERSLA